MSKEIARRDVTTVTEIRRAGSRISFGGVVEEMEPLRAGAVQMLFLRRRSHNASPWVRGLADTGYLAGGLTGVAGYGAIVAVGWAVIACWYTVIFGCFGLLTVPWKLMMRSQRRAANQRAAMLEIAMRQRRRDDDS